MSVLRPTATRRQSSSRDPGDAGLFLAVFAIGLFVAAPLLTAWLA